MEKKPSQHIDAFPQPLTMGGNIPDADESPERVLNLNNFTHGNRITYVAQDFSLVYFIQFQRKNIARTKFMIITRI